MFKGSMVAIVTPFDREGRFDEENYRQLIEFQIENGTDFIVPCGTTGESATLDYKEHDQVIKACIEQVNKRIPVIAGTGSNSTAEAIELSRHAKEMGADGVLLVSPYYNKPSQEGLYLHYKAIAEAVALPQVLYNVPGRTGMNMEAEPPSAWPNSPTLSPSRKPRATSPRPSEIIAKPATRSTSSPATTSSPSR